MTGTDSPAIKPIKLAIAGTRGIPNQYGGFEQCAEFLSVLLSEMNYEVTVYNSHYHPYRENNFGKVNIVHINNPEHTVGTAGNFFYDRACMHHAVKNNFDILLMLGYTTASVFYPSFNFDKTILVTNMDGLEWKRDKWNMMVKKLAKWFEKLAAENSRYLVSDNTEIRNYLLRTYRRDSEFIPYGCAPFTSPDENSIGEYNVKVGEYGMILARMEAENNIGMMLEGFTDSKQKGKILVTGNTTTGYGKAMLKKFGSDPRVVFTQGIYNLEKLNNLRYFSSYYLHGHSVGGTNPALLEAMASGAFIIAHGNEFNRSVLESDALFFNSARELTLIFDEGKYGGSCRKDFIEHNLHKVRSRYNWKIVAGQYDTFFRRIFVHMHG